MSEEIYTRERIMKVCNDLLGTCKSLDEVLQEEFNNPELTMTDLPMPMLAVIDEQVWLCAQCGWWVEPHEVDDEDICDECRGEQ